MGVAYCCFIKETILIRSLLSTAIILTFFFISFSLPSFFNFVVEKNLVKPTDVRITQVTPILVAGSDALFECNSYGSRPMPTIYWLFDGQRFDTRIHGELFYMLILVYYIFL